jgi:hypothetical protein
VSLAHRVADLEDYSGGICAACGHDPSATVTYRIVWEGEKDAPLESSVPCPRCGNVAVLVVNWQDERSEQHSYEQDGEGAAAQVPDYPPVWNDEGGGVDGY